MFPKPLTGSIQNGQLGQLSVVMAVAHARHPAQQLAELRVVSKILSLILERCVVLLMVFFGMDLGRPSQQLVARVLVLEA